MLRSLLRSLCITSVLVAIVPLVLFAQVEDSAHVGIHQAESELHRWDALKTHPKVPDLEKGADLVRAGDFQGAMRVFQKAAPLRKSYAYFNLGLVHFETGSLEKAQRYFQLSYNARRDPVCLEYLGNVRRLLNERSRPR